jgi:linoleate 10R-lipoxygenase
MTLIDQFARGVDFLTETRAPLDTDGGRPVDGSFENEISKIRQLWSNPAIQLSDLVCQLTLAVKVC